MNMSMIFLDGDYDLEIRLVPAIGLLFSDKNKFELSFDNRIDSFISGSIRFRFFLGVSWFYTM